MATKITTKKTDGNNPVFAVIRIRGRVGLKHKVSSTLDQLGLKRKHSCILLSESQQGMLEPVKNWVTWGEIEAPTLIRLLKKRAKLTGFVNNRKLDEQFLKFESLANDIILSNNDNNKTCAKLLLKQIGIKPVFRLTPPSRGFKGSIKQPYPKGELGYRASPLTTC